MKIIIDYEASWRNSFLGGTNDKPVPKNKKGKFERDFVASMKQLGESKNYIERKVTKNTVMGVLSRLIGDQRKLHQSKSSDNYYFADMEDKITFDDIDAKRTETNEMVYIRNMTGSTDQNAFTGMIKVNDPIFQSDYSSEFWGVLALEVDELCSFILQDTEVNAGIPLDPTSILSRLETIKKIKPMAYEGKIKQASDELSTHFEKYKPLNKKEEQLILPMYCSALYLQLKRLECKHDMSSAKSKMGGISGISNNGFTPKDFMDKYTTGAKKRIYGNPYIREEFIKGEGKIKHTLTKASGQLEINLDIDLAKAKELKNMIECAGVSSFYLGKKGLAYVSEITAR